MMEANIIPLEFWKDPQSDVILVYGERECSVYFRRWSSAGVPADYIGELSFEGASAVRSFDREFIPYQTKRHEKSYILQVPDSDLARNRVEYRKRHYPQYLISGKTHFVVVGHDIYHEILATKFTAATINRWYNQKRPDRVGAKFTTGILYHDGKEGQARKLGEKKEKSRPAP